MLSSVPNTTTEKLLAEIVVVVRDVALIDNCDRQFTWSTEDEKKLNYLNKVRMSLQPWQNWTWGASDDSEQG